MSHRATPAETAATSATAEPSGAACANCGAALHGRFCQSCGQDADARVDSLRGFVRESLGDLVHLDSRGLRTVRDLLVRPGRLTAAYFQGHRVRYLSAIQIYLIAAALFFFANSASPFIRVDRETGAVQSALGIMGVGAEERAELPHGMSAAEFEDRLRTTANNQLPAFLIGVVALFALLVAATYPLRERNLLKHVVFALHWTSFYMAILILERISGREPGNPDAMSAIVAALGLAWLTVALRRTYGQNWAVSLAKGVWLFLAFNMLLALWVGGVLAWALRTI